MYLSAVPAYTDLCIYCKGYDFLITYCAVLSEYLMILVGKIRVGE